MVAKLIVASRRILSRISGGGGTIEKPEKVLLCIYYMQATNDFFSHLNQLNAMESVFLKEVKEGTRLE